MKRISCFFENLIDSRIVRLNESAEQFGNMANATPLITGQQRYGDVVTNKFAAAGAKGERDFSRQRFFQTEKQPAIEFAVEIGKMIYGTLCKSA